MEGSAASSSGIKIGVDSRKFDAGREPFEHWKAFFEFLKNRQPPRSLSDCTANDAVEFLRCLLTEKVEAVARSVSADTCKSILGSIKENPFDSQIVRTFLMEFAEEQKSEEEYRKKKLSQHNKVDLFEMRLKTKDVDHVDSLLIPYKDARKYFFPYNNFEKTIGYSIPLEDEDGKRWLFGYSLDTILRRCEFTRGWSRYVNEKQLSAGDSVFFQRDHTDSWKLFIGCIKHDGAAPRIDAHEYSRRAVLNPTSPVTSETKLELREKLKEVETPFQQRWPEYSIPVVEPVLVISCGSNQDSAETYFISCISNELCLRGFTPCRYDLTRSTVNRNQNMLYKSRVCIIIITTNQARSRECMVEFMAIMGCLNANNLALLPVFFNVMPGSFRNSVQASQVQKWREAMNKLFVYKRHHCMKGDEVMVAKNIVRDVCLLTSSETCRSPLSSLY